MLTIFSWPGSFTGGPLEMIQRSAIESWLKLEIKPRVVMLGNEKGVTEFCREKGLEQYATTKTAKDKKGSTAEMFRWELKNADKTKLYVYIKPNLLLNDDFSETARFLDQSITCSFLATGRVKAMELTQKLSSKKDFHEAQCLISGKEDEPPEVLDYFFFVPGTLPALPDFSMDGPWEQWLIWATITARIPVIDLSGRTTVIRLDDGEGEQRVKKPTAAEIKLAGGEEHFGNLLDADYIFQNGELVKNRSMEYYERRFLHPLLALKEKMLKPIPFHN